MGFRFKPLSAHVFVDIVPADLEGVFQAWLAAHAGIHIKQIAQSQNGTGLITLTCLYVMP